MLVKELMEILQEFDPESEVILQKDAEGNGHSPLSFWYSGYYVAESTYSGSIFADEWSADDCGMDEDEWEKMREDTPLTMVLVPIN
jgi:hypothetical protein